MKIISFYLPQFHEIEENNRAWGKGFTEWDNVKTAKSLFKGHNQPRKPLNNNYYNLTDINVIKWQAKLAQKYGIDGFCFYHYWFKDGKHVLEKPSELFLYNKDIDLQFCFSWANEPWTKTWHGASGEKEVLLEQHYGEKKQWKEHFEYLLQFFQDKRYIIKDNKPIFLIYHINKIGCFRQMIDYWNKLAMQNGFDGLYIIDMLTVNGKVYKDKRVAASVDFEPSKAFRKTKINNCGISLCDYDEAYMKMLSVSHKKNAYRCVFVDYDDSPRRGANGIAFKGSFPEKFGKYLQKTIQLSEKEGNDIIFINAWNEWGESNYLEPDVINKYKYLEAVKNAIELKYEDIEDITIKSLDIQIDKFRQYYDICNRWIKLINDGYSIEKYFNEKGYNTIAIYGMGELGNRLLESLSNTKVTIAYGINKDMWDAYAEIDVLSIDEEEKFVGIDCIIVTPIHIFTKIKKDLSKKCSCDIISLEDVIFGI